MGIAPLLLLAAGLWNRQAGCREAFVFSSERYLPAAVELDQLAALPTEAKDPDVMMVMLGVGGAEPLLGFLHAHGTVGFRREEPQGRFAVMFRETLDPALLQDLRPHPPRSQRLIAQWGKERRECAIEPGSSLEAAGGRFRVVAQFPDFEVHPDAQGRPVMGSRSAEPKDPWLEVEYLKAEQPPRRVLLSARQPELTERLNAPNLPKGLSLRYLRDGEELQTRYVVFSRNDHRVSLVENGALTRSEATATQRPFVVAPGLSATALGFFDRFYPAPALSNGLPAMRVRIADQVRGGSEQAWLRPNDSGPTSFFNQKVRVSMLPGIPGTNTIALDVSVQDTRGGDWPAQRVMLPEGGNSTLLQLQRRPGAWLGWAALVLFLLGAGGWLVGWRLQASGSQAEQEPHAASPSGL